MWAHVTITPVRNADHSLVGFAKVTRDLTERVRNDEQLRRLAAENAVFATTSRIEKVQRVRREFLAHAGEALVSSLEYRTTLAARGPAQGRVRTRAG